MKSFLVITQFFFSLSKKIFKSSPNFTIVIFLGLISQIFLVASFIIPIKVIVTLYNKSVPAYVNSFIDNVSLDGFVIVLSLLAVCSFLLNLFLSKFRERLIDNNSFLIVTKAGNRKKASLERVFASKAYDLIVRVWSNLFLQVLYVTGLILLLPKLGFFALFCLLSICSYIVYKVGLFKSFYGNVANTIQKNIVDSCNFGFIVCFIFFASSLYFDSFSATHNYHVVIFIVSLIFCRQIFQRLSVIFKDLLYIGDNKFKISDLYYSNPTAIKSIKVREKTEKTEFLVHKLPSVIKNALRDHFGVNFDLSWSDLPVKNLIFFKATFDECNFDLFIKVYENSESHSVRSEVDFIYSSVPRKIFPEPVFSFMVNAYKVVVLKTAKNIAYTGEHKNLAIMAKTMSYNTELSSEEIVYFEKQYTDLPSRLISHDLRRLELVVRGNKSDHLIINSFEKELPNIVAFLRGVPKTFVNFELDPNSLINTSQGPCFLNFSKLRFDIIFSDIKFGKEEHLYDLNSLLSYGFDNITNLSNNDIKRIIVLSEFERAFAGRQYKKSLDLLHRYFESNDTNGS